MSAFLFALSTLVAVNSMAGESVPDEPITDALTADETSSTRTADDGEHRRIDIVESTSLAGASITTNTTKPLLDRPLATSRLADLQSYVPGLIADEQPILPGSAALNLRGTGSRFDNGHTLYPAVAVYVDDIYIGTHVNQNVSLLDVNHVVSSATPSTSFAAPHLGGVIRLVEHQPGETLWTRVSLTAGDVSGQGQADLRTAAFTINAPLTGQLRSRIALSSEEGGRDVVYNRHLDREVNTSNNKQGLLKLRWQNPYFHAGYRFRHQRNEQFGPPLLNLSPQSDLLCNVAVRCSESGRGTVAETESLDDVDQNSLAFAARPQDSGGHTLQSDTHSAVFDSLVAGHRVRLTASETETETMSSLDIDASPVDFLGEHATSLINQHSVALSVTGSHQLGSYTLMLDRIEIDQHVERTRFHIVNRLIAVGQLPPDFLDHSLASRNTQNASVDSVAFLTTWQFGRSWDLIVNARYTDAISDIVRENSVVATDSLPRQFTRNEHSIGSDAVLGELEVRYAVDEDADLYARFSRGHRPAGLDATLPGNHIAFQAEHLDAFETGVTTRWWQDRLKMTLRLFQHNHRDKPEHVLVTQQGQLAPALANRARVEVRGSEFNLQYNPMTSLHVELRHTHLAADYLTFTVPAAPPLPAGSGNTDLSSTVPERSPSDNIAIRAVYTLPGKHLSFDAGYRYVSSYWSNSLLDAARIESFTLWDLQARYQRKRWSVDLFVRNTNDKRHLNQVATLRDTDVLPTGARLDPVSQPLGLLRYATPAPGRLAGLRFSVQIGEE